jgi:hypothetical protein
LEIVQRAVQAVQRNLFALGLYLLITVTASAAGITVSHALGSSEESAFSKGTLFFCGVGIDACLAIASAVAQAIVFSRFAKDIDRPLWRIQDDREALQRYFLLWIVLNACLSVLGLLSMDVPQLLDNEGFGFFPRWLFLFANAVYIPLGAAMMFMRTANWRNIGEALVPHHRLSLLVDDRAYPADRPPTMARHSHQCHLQLFRLRDLLRRLVHLHVRPADSGEHRL